MKKKILTALSIALVFLLLVSCSSGSGGDSSSSTLNYAPGAANESYSYGDMAATDSIVEYDSEMPKSDISTISGLTSGASANASLAEKIIYSANASIETIVFDETLVKLSELLTRFDAFVESSNVTGADYTTKYYGYNAYRSANYVIRVPRESFSAMSDALAELGNVVSLTTNSTNVTEQYTDTESRLTVYRIEEARLLVMLEKCETVADMLTIESSLSNLRYQIESLTSQLKNLDNRVNYSSVTLYIREVEELSEAAQTHMTYGQQLKNGFTGTLTGVGNFFKGLVRVIITGSPVIIIIAVVLIIAALVYRRVRKGKKAPSQDESQNKQ